MELLLNNKAETYFKFLNIHALHFACLVRNRDKLLKMEESHKDVYSFAHNNKLQSSIGIQKFFFVNLYRYDIFNFV